MTYKNRCVFFIVLSLIVEHLVGFLIVRQFIYRNHRVVSGEKLLLQFTSMHSMQEIIFKAFISSVSQCALDRF